MTDRDPGQKPLLIITSKDALKDLEATGMRDQFVQQYQIMLPTQYEMQRQLMEKGLLGDEFAANPDMTDSMRKSFDTLKQDDEELGGGAVVPSDTPPDKRIKAMSEAAIANQIAQQYGKDVPVTMLGLSPDATSALNYLTGDPDVGPPEHEGAHKDLQSFDAARKYINSSSSPISRLKRDEAVTAIEKRRRASEIASGKSDEIEGPLMQLGSKFQKAGKALTGGVESKWRDGIDKQVEKDLKQKSKQQQIKQPDKGKKPTGPTLDH